MMIPISFIYQKKKILLSHNFKSTKIIPFNLCIMMLVSVLSACTLGPNYHRPPMIVPLNYKEAYDKILIGKPNKNWKVAQPRDDEHRGKWWQRFNDLTLNQLENQLLHTNQNIAQAQANFFQAVALVDEARASYYPTINFTTSAIRQKSSGGSSTFSNLTQTAQQPTNVVQNNGVTATTSNRRTIFTTYSVSVPATWEPDLWGLVRRTVEANTAYAQSTAALLANIQLSSGGALAQYYFELRALDTDQYILNSTINRYKKALVLTRNQYRSGTAAQSDILQAESQLLSAQASAIQNGINRGIYEHAIAVLIGQPPASFSLPAQPLTKTPPAIPLTIPSTLLERRPDIAQAERLVKQANAEIGVAISAYFPVLLLSGSGDRIGIDRLAKVVSLPLLGWSIGAQLTQILFDSGLRDATVKAAYASYQSTVANYRQVVLAAFQNVEDNLITLRLLAREATVQNQAAITAKKALHLILNQYKAGTVNYSSVITAQITAFMADKNAADITGLRMTAAVGLIVALGGDWVDA